MKRNKGVKHDKEKAPLSWLGPFRFTLSNVAKIFAGHGLRKYSKDNWKYVENGEIRYIDAALRHIFAYTDEEVLDPDSGQNHLEHAICNLLMARERRRMTDDGS